jgi:hypothetical protein
VLRWNGVSVTLLTEGLTPVTLQQRVGEEREGVGALGALEPSANVLMDGAGVDVKALLILLEIHPAQLAVIPILRDEGDFGLCVLVHAHQGKLLWLHFFPRALLGFSRIPFLARTAFSCVCSVEAAVD